MTKLKLNDVLAGKTIETARYAPGGVYIICTDGTVASVCWDGQRQQVMARRGDGVLDQLEWDFDPPPKPASPVNERPQPGIYVAKPPDGPAVLIEIWYVEDGPHYCLRGQHKLWPWAPHLFTNINGPRRNPR